MSRERPSSIQNHGDRPLTRRDLLGFAARGAVGVVVTQSLTGCDASASPTAVGESLTDAVHATSPYASRGTRDTLKARDGIYNGLSDAEKSALTLEASETADGYAGVINLGVQVG